MTAIAHTEHETESTHPVILAMTEIVSQKYGEHPFLNHVTRENAESVMADYLAMSKAFPYIAAGAQKDQILRVMDGNGDVPDAMEITSVVSNFLSWDETGGHYLVCQHGNAGLPDILSTKIGFHGNMLQADLLKIFGKPVAPNFSRATSRYLKQLLDSLSSSDAVVRASALAAFEMHAENMITALWESLVRIFGIKREELIYFQVHVGGEDPAEAYHVAMTQRMLDEILGNGPQSDGRFARFLDLFEQSYADNYNWCKALTEAV